MKQYRPHFLVLFILVAVLLTGMHKTVQNALIDARYGWFPRQAGGEIVLISIDPSSIEAIGTWPWPRSIHADLIDKLERAGAGDIVFDIDFSSPSTPDSDAAFEDALQRAGGSVVLPAFKQLVSNRGVGNTTYVNRPLPRFGEHAWSAIVNLPVDPDGLVRHFRFGETLEGNYLPVAGAMLAGRYDKDDQHYLIDFSIRPKSIPSLSYIDALRGDAATLAGLKGKKVIIGATALELGDRLNVPNGRILTGALLQALVAESILQGRVLQVTSYVVTMIGISIVALVMFAMWRRRSAGFRALVLAMSATVAELGATVVQAKLPIVIDTSLFLIAISGYLAVIALYEIDLRGLLGAIAERRFQTITMSLGDGLVCTNTKGDVVLWNRGAATIFGYEANEMIGQPFNKILALSGGDGNRHLNLIGELPRGELVAPGGKVMELDGRRKNGKIFPLEVCFSGWQGTDGFQFGAILRDISVRKREAERIKYLAEHDTLTGLANRHTLRVRLGEAFAKASRAGTKVAILVMDLDNFKEINDTMSHACGDQVLCEVAQVLRTLIGDTGLIARLGGDEFAVVIAGDDLAHKAQGLVDRIARAFKNTELLIDGQAIRIKCSFGVAIFPEHCRTEEELLANADLALYRAKAAGRGTHMFFNRQIRDEIETRRSLQAELERAVERHEFELFYQPQVRLADGRLVGVEALIRWRHPDRGLVLPAEFMPLVNASSIAERLGLWVMEAACMQGREWQRQGHALRIGVNLSPSQIHSGNLAASAALVLKKTGLSPSLLELEVTENILIEDDERARDIFQRIRNLGIGIALDDFGTGYASLTYLKKFPLDRLKIDRSFVRELRATTDDAAIVQSTVSLSKMLGLSVIAEGIEDRTTAELLVSMGCDEGQGYYFSPALPAAEFEKMFLSKNVVADSDARSVERAASAA